MADPLLSQHPDGTWRFLLGDRYVCLTRGEARIISTLMAAAGGIVRKADLNYTAESNSIEVLVGRIRKKLGPRIITTHRKCGYSWSFIDMQIYSFTLCDETQPREYYAKCDVQRVTRLLSQKLHPQGPIIADLERLLERVTEDEMELEAQL